MKEESRRVVFLDVCDTLFLSNTSFDFLKWYLKSKSFARYFFYLFLTHKLSPLFWFYLVVGRVRGRDIIRIKALSLLKGYTKDDLTEAAKLFYSQFLEHRKNRKVWDIINQFNVQAEVVILSASIDNVINEVGAKLGATKVYSSRLKYRENICLGVLEEDLQGKKHEYAESFLKDGRTAITITDNLSDAELVKRSGKAYLLVYKPWHIERWSKLADPINTTFIKMY